MIPITVADGARERALFAQLKERSGEVDARVTAAVQAILQDVKLRGDAAVREYTQRFDGVAPDCVEVTRAEIDAAAGQCAPEFVAALIAASENIWEFHRQQRQNSWFTTKENGVMLGQRVRGLKRVGVYVPGGTAAYPSSVLMNVIPAKVAGVQEVVMVTPPQSGGANPNILAAAQIAGVDRVFLVGGAQACAALAYGTETIPRVDKITGPGNIFVATAKKLLYGQVDIDMIAGPSEILVIADESANPRFLAADLLSQAEHDRLASAILLTTSQRIAQAVRQELELQLNRLPRKEIAAEALRNYGAILVCESMTQMLEFANDLAPEHLELCVEDAMRHLGTIENAGSVFLGHFSPESLGDYYAGPNHVLPTGGTTRFFSPLSVDDFIKKLQFISYTESALHLAGDEIVTLARTEGFDAHAYAVRTRFEENETEVRHGVSDQ
ncbi:MAG: histidinol dehydrogenase [Oscillospiraceae bacterium]|jgi:histidinol dehydrogenase|nr:histidinol dehydrogenase [Oscillospiraceae bacterium]